MPPQAWDHQTEQAVLLAFQKHATPTNEEMIAIMADLNKQGFTFSRDALRYERNPQALAS